MMNRWSVPRTLGAKEEYGSLLWAQLGGFLEEAALEVGVELKVSHPMEHV